MKKQTKALELVSKFVKLGFTLQSSKECALIAVDEIISIKLLWYLKDTKELDYWKEVKQEIEKL